MRWARIRDAFRVVFRKARRGGPERARTVSKAISAQLEIQIFGQIR